MTDIYDLPEYGRLCELIEGGKSEIFVYENDVGKVVDQFIVRPISIRLNGRQLYDAITPYGYGGPRIVEGGSVEVREQLIREADAAFSAFCKEKGIVAQFIRFHPLYGNAADWNSCFDVCYSRKTVAVDLTDPDYMMNQFSATCRNKIRKAAKKGVTIVVDEACKNMEAFKELYYKTMHKNDATDFYMFSDVYFDQMIKTMTDRVLLIHAYLEDEIIGGGLFLKGDEFLHNHLSATDPKYYACAANNAFLAASVEYGRKNGLKWMHIGGGLSGAADDPLLEFKRSFGKNDANLMDFYIGKRILDLEAYNELVALRVRENPNFDRASSFFPLYRA